MAQMTRMQIEQSIAAQLPGHRVVTVSGSGVKKEGGMALNTDYTEDVPAYNADAQSPSLTAIKSKYAQIFNRPVLSDARFVLDAGNEDADGEGGDILAVITPTAAGATSAGPSAEKAVIVSSKTGKVVGFQG